MDKVIRTVNEQLWREVKAQAALEGKNMTQWVEEVLAAALKCPEKIPEGLLKKYRLKKKADTFKIIKNMNEQLWRRAKAQAALEGKSTKDWVEEVIAFGLAKKTLQTKGNEGSTTVETVEKTKIIRNIDEQLWRRAKARAALEGKSMKDWVEGVIGFALAEKQIVPDDVLKKYRKNKSSGKAKILRNINEHLWIEAKARAALEGKSMKDWVEGVIAYNLEEL